jgi:hypothetical protein
VAVGPTPSAAYRSRLAALSEGHAQWVDRELPGARFDAAGRRAKSDYNQHYVDLEADDDAFHAAARAALGLSSLVEATRSRHVLDDGICVTCQPHELVDGECVPCGTVASRNFNINEPREPHSGKWTAGPGGAVKDVLKLAGKLGKDEHLVASNKVKFRDGNIFMATTEVGGERHLRFGLPEFDESSGEALPWRPNGPHTANLDQRGTETLRQGFDELDQMGREHVKKAKAIADRMDAAPHGSPDYKAAQPMSGAAERSRRVWTIVFLGMSRRAITGAAVGMELWAGLDSSPDTVPWTDLLTRYVPQPITFAALAVLTAWLPIHFTKAYQRSGGGPMKGFKFRPVAWMTTILAVLTALEALNETTHLVPDKYNSWILAPSGCSPSRSACSRTTASRPPPRRRTTPAHRWYRSR